MTNNISYYQPIKIIHKYKNNNRRIQYIIYIFLGFIIDEELINILESIKKKKLFDSINFLSKSKINILENKYGEFWYQSFFNRYHIIDQFNNIMKNKDKLKIIESKMGIKWIQKHISDIPIKKRDYSFASNYYDYLILKNKIKSQIRKNEMDFRTYNLEENKLVGGRRKLGGMDDMNKDDMNNDDEIDQEKNEEDVVEDDETDEIDDDDVNEDYNLEELTQLYSMDQISEDKHIKETSKLISEAIKDNKYTKQSNNTELNFIDTYDEIGYDTKIEDVFEKHYIKNQFVFIDDTIKTIKNKIAVSIPLSSKYGDDIKLLPEYMYFWTEYNLQNTIDYVMLGQKWIRKNELVKIDIKPNENLSVYENLRNNLSYLKDSFGVKIKREDDEYNILRDYSDYMINNEIYMLDIINELGINYRIDSEKKKNIYEVYVNIYYPLISYERFEDIVMLLNSDNTKELELNINQFGIIKNDITLEKEIYTIIEETKTKSLKYNKFFNVNHIIQSIIHINLYNSKNITGTISSEKFNLYKIFDNFIVTEEYPFIQYMTPDSQLTYKLFTKTNKLNDINIINKWFENTSYGLSFKIKAEDIENKYISINMSETGRLEYKITWKEENVATIDDIKKSYQYIFNLLLKINNENKKIKIILPEENMFKYAFINTIQKFNIPDKFRINHNDLSDFSRFFYTHISLVIEPKKRVSASIKDVETSKFGTYLRYKRIGNYENKTKNHLRILYYIRNFEISNKELIDEISKQFNITPELARDELEEVRKKYAKILGKTKRKLRKLTQLPKSKPPGINIDIQGRDPSNYKIRITGARSKEQLDEIIEFIKVLIYLYIETYLLKNPKYQKIRESLVKLTKIAKRRNKVSDYYNYESNTINVKQITGLDKKRLAFKPDEGESQWTRSCQNSGTDKKRRPIIISNNDIKDLIKRGYKLNSSNNTYEKKSVITVNKQKKPITVKAIKLVDEGSKFNYFTCDPDENGEHSYIGFLSKSNNPNDLCMPCCFKKDQEKSMNKKKQNYYNKCIGQKINNDDSLSKVDSGLGDKIYILQDTNKIQDGRFIFLPKYLNHFFNGIWKHDYKIKNHYMIESKSGFYFKYTVKNENYYFLSAISHIYNTTIDLIKEKMIDTIMKDIKDIIFTSLNNGDIKSMFTTRETFIKYLQTSNYIEYDIIGELLCIPNIITPKGIIYYIFDKKIKIIKKNLEKDEYLENYYLQCLNIENYQYNDMDKDIVILIKDGKYFFPIYRVKKGPKDKKIILHKHFNINDPDNEKIINELKQYYKLSCIDNFIYNINSNSNITAKMIENMGVDIKKQIIDDRNKVRYLILESGLFLPVKPSGSLLNINIYNIRDIKQTNLMDIATTLKLLNVFNKKMESYKLNYIPKTFYYSSTKNSQYNITSIYLMNNMIIPVKNTMMTNVQFKKYGLGYEFQPIEEMIDTEINKHVINDDTIYDTRSINVKNRVYRSEAYNLFRLELSIFLSNNNDIKNNIIAIVKNKNMTKKEKKYELINIIIKIVETKSNKFIHIIKQLPELKNYKVSNTRDYCKINKNKNKCNENLHCMFINDTCIFIMYNTDIISNINKIVEEMIINGIKFKEIITDDTYYVSDIVDHTIFTDRPNQKIIKTSNLNIKKIMKELFGKDSIPQIGRKRTIKYDLNVEENYPELIELGKQLIQPIISNNNSIIRAYVNCYYWLHNSMYDKESRNLGYFSELQNTLTHLFKANIIDYITNNSGLDMKSNDLNKDIEKYFGKKQNIDSKNIFTTIINKFRKNNYNTDGILELTILSYMFSYPIVVFDNFNNVKYIFSNGLVSVNEKTSKKYTSDINITKTIFIKFDFEGGNDIPTKISSIYYI